MSSERDGFRRERVELEPGTIHYRESGSGEPQLFVHGFGVGGNLWEGTAAALAGSRRCILPELPFGSHPEPMKRDADLSPPAVARLLAELIERLELERPTVVANDSGGAIAQILATEHPGTLGRLVLTNCDTFEDFPPGVFKLLARLIKVPGAGFVLANSLRFDFARRLPIAYGALTMKRLDRELLDSWVRPQIENRGVRRDARKFFGAVHPRYTLAAAEKASSLEIPVLFAWGEDDRFFKLEDARRLAERIPDARVVPIPEARTFVPLDQPERLAGAIASFLRSTGTAREPGAAVAADGSAGEVGGEDEGGEGPEQ